MSDNFEFAIRTPRLALGDDRTSESVVDVTSRLGRHEQVTVELDAAEGTDPSWFTIEPADLSLQDGETTSVQVSVSVPADVVAGDYEFSLRAYAVSDPQNDFTVSQVSTIEVSEAEPGGVPAWLLIALIALAVVLLFLVIWFLFFRGTSGAVDDVIAEPVAEARATLEENFTVLTFPDGTGTESESCVLLQSPEAGSDAKTVSLLTTKCPTRSPLVALPEILSRLCEGASFDFCREVDRDFPSPPSNEEWKRVSGEMAADFREAFTIDGVDTPNVVGMTQIAAREALQEAGLAFSEVADGGPGTGCTVDGQLEGPPVLLQHPFADLPTPSDSVVTLVLTTCPEEAQSVDEVDVVSLINLDTFANLRSAVPPFAQVIVDDQNLGPDFIGSEVATATFGDMLRLFKQQFAVPRVPDVRTNRISAATTLLEDLGLEVIIDEQIGPDISIFGFCPVERVTTQSIGPGAPVATLTQSSIELDTKVTYEQCRFIVTDLTAQDSLAQDILRDNSVFAVPTP